MSYSINGNPYGHVPVGTGQQIPSVYGYTQGHVPVGTGQQIPNVTSPQQQSRSVTLSHTTIGPYPVTVCVDGGDPSRQIPSRGRGGMKARAHLVPPQSPLTVHLMHQHNLQNPRARTTDIRSPYPPV